MMIQVQKLEKALEASGNLVERRGEPPASVAGVADDSRLIDDGYAFIAVRGVTGDGHAFIGDAEARGAALAIVEDPSLTMLPCLVVRNGRRAAATAAAVAFSAPARRMTLIGVTGTNGKSTTVALLRHLLDDSGERSASVGTLGVLVGSEGDLVEVGMGSGLTTPGPVELHRSLKALVDMGVRTVAIEVSSHSLDQRRVEGIQFKAAVFTNITQDHLDYHHTMEEYFQSKARLLEYLGPGGTAVINADEPMWRNLPVRDRTITFGLQDSSADVRAVDVRYEPRGSEWTLVVGGDSRRVRFPLVGSFNLSNALGAAAAALALGADLGVVAARLATLPQVPGRLEVISENPVVVRDYAHTPDALQRALDALRPFARGRLIAVFGCGGDRDRAKRPVMGAIAESLADKVILTSDNPRTEDPERILDDIEAGMRRAGTHERIEDRRAAIARALSLAGPGDLVLLAGKGHETYQIRGTMRHPFDERQIVSELLEVRT